MGDRMGCKVFSQTDADIVRQVVPGVFKLPEPHLGLRRLYSLHHWADHRVGDAVEKNGREKVAEGQLHAAHTQQGQHKGEGQAGLSPPAGTDELFCEID